MRSSDETKRLKAEASAPKRQPAEPDAEYAALIERLREAVKANPEDPRGLELLAEHESRLGNTIAAKDAQARLVALRGDAPQGQDRFTPHADGFASSVELIEAIAARGDMTIRCGAYPEAHPESADTAAES